MSMLRIHVRESVCPNPPVHDVSATKVKLFNDILYRVQFVVSNEIKSRHQPISCPLFTRETSISSSLDYSRQNWFLPSTLFASRKLLVIESDDKHIVRRGITEATIIIDYSRKTQRHRSCQYSYWVIFNQEQHCFSWINRFLAWMKDPIPDWVIRITCASLPLDFSWPLTELSVWIVCRNSRIRPDYTEATESEKERENTARILTHRHQPVNLSAFHSFLVHSTVLPSSSSLSWIRPDWSNLGILTVGRIDFTVLP